MSRSDYFATVGDTGGRVAVTCRCGVTFSLMLHHDAKTSPAVMVERSGRAVARVANAWPLPVGPVESGGSCPGVTSACRDCYAGGLEAAYPAFRRGMAGNLEALHHLYGCGGVSLVGRVLADLVRHSERAQRAYGVRRPVFRWHSSGDVFADWYARAIVRAVDATPDVEHWAYTRTLSAVGILRRASALSLYVSADFDNVERAARVAVRHGVPLAMLATDPAHAVALWGRAGAVAPGVLGAPVTCPATAKWAHDGRDVGGHVVGADGRRASVSRGAPGVGACVACRACLPSGAGRPVTFLVHGGQARGDSAGRLGAAVRVRMAGRS